ncbi:MAG: glycerate kinase, partial [Muribaculaceae bacterium]|nr:glycerate kinase [Muribaculaceae bacterium]
MLAFLGASLKPGIKTILSLAGFETVISGADLIVTGEGKIDRSTFMGKGPFGIMQIARRHNIPVIALAGSVADDISADGLCDIITVTPPDMPLATALDKDVAACNIRNAISSCLTGRHRHS